LLNQMADQAEVLRRQATDQQGIVWLCEIRARDTERSLEALPPQAGPDSSGNDATAAELREAFDRYAGLAHAAEVLHGEICAVSLLLP
jgi:hypothetical protein